MSSLDGYNVMKDQETNSLSERLNEVKMEMELLDAQMGCVLGQRDKAVERIKFLRIQRDKGVCVFYFSCQSLVLFLLTGVFNLGCVLFL